MVLGGESVAQRVSLSSVFRRNQLLGVGISAEHEDTKASTEHRLIGKVKIGDKVTNIDERKGRASRRGEQPERSWRSKQMIVSTKSTAERVKAEYSYTPYEQRVSSSARSDSEFIGLIQ